MDRSLDDVIGERRQNNRSNPRNGRRNGRGGIRKPTSKRDEFNDDRLWVHDKFSLFPQTGVSKETFSQGYRGGRGTPGGQSGDSKLPPGAAKIRVDNLHYDLGEDELMNLFQRIGPVYKLDLIYDRAGRSEGTAFVVYESESDASRAIRDFNGANANGQPISLTFVTHGNAVHTQPRSLFDRIKETPEERRGPRVDPRRDPTRKPTPPGIDRYVPPERRRAGGSAPEKRNGGSERRERRGVGRREVSIGGGSGSRHRSAKTVEELDEEMNDYFATGEGPGVQSTGSAGTEGINPFATNDTPTGAAQATPAAVADEDEDMVL